MDFETALSQWIARLQEQLESYYAANYTHIKPGRYKAMHGPKYVRVIRVENNDALGSAYAFVEKATGNIFKPAGWKGPEKNFPRGNIYDVASSMSWTTPHGMNTAR